MNAQIRSLKQIGESKKAIHVEQHDRRGNVVKAWIPLSQISHRLTQKVDDVTWVDLVIPDWLAEKAGLAYD